MFPGAAPRPPTSHPVTIVDVRLLDGDSGQLREGPIRLAGGLIDAIGEAPQPGDEIVDASGGVAIPGLIDAHLHAFAVSVHVRDNEQLPMSYLALAAAERLGAALRRGFTTVRDVAGGDPGLGLAIDEGLVPAPRYYYTGPALSQTGGHGDGRTRLDGCCAYGGRTVEVVDGPDAVRAAARERLRQGAHAVKIMTSGGVVSPTDPLETPQYSPEEIRAATDEARRRGSYVTSHAYSPAAIRHAVANGVTCIEHGNLADEETLLLLRDSDVGLVPTLAAYAAIGLEGDSLGVPRESLEKNRGLLAAGRESLSRAVRLGVRTGFGTDLMGGLERHQLQGLRLHCEVVGALETIRAATATNAAILGRPDLGVLDPGTPADLLVLAGNPLETPSLLWDTASPRTVILAGSVVRDSAMAGVG